MGITIHDKMPKTYMVTGCHNSATSLISLALARCGVNIGNDVMPEVYETFELVALNNSILLEAGGSWFDPPSDEAIAAVKANNRITKLVAEYEDVGFWALKDPRLCLTGKHYLPHLNGRDAYLICCFRKPERALESIRRRLEGQPHVDHYFTPEFVNRYNESLIELIKTFCEWEGT